MAQAKKEQLTLAKPKTHLMFQHARTGVYAPGDTAGVRAADKLWNGPYMVEEVLNDKGKVMGYTRVEEAEVSAEDTASGADDPAAD